MAKKRGRPKKLPLLQIKEFDRQFGQAQLPALLVDQELTVVYANDYARAVFPGVDQPGGLRALLTKEDREKCIRHINEKKCCRIGLPSADGVPTAMAVTPVAEEGSEQTAGAMVFVTCSSSLDEPAAGGDGVIAISKSMRQPLSNIFSSLAVIRRQTRIVGQDSQGSQSEPYLNSISEASYQLLRNVNNLVSYQQGLSGRRGQVEVVDFWARLAPIMDACGIILNSSDIPFTFELPDKQYIAHVSCCFDEVVDALMNIISNAFRHSRPGNRVEVTGKNITNWVMVTVSDCGRGIEPDQLEDIYSPFYSRGKDGEAFVGLGLGLTVAKQNIALNNGKFAVNSILGKGTSITFTLPTCDKPLSPPLVLASDAAQLVQDPFSKIYIGLCDVATLPPL